MAVVLKAGSRGPLGPQLTSKVTNDLKPASRHFVSFFFKLRTVFQLDRKCCGKVGGRDQKGPLGPPLPLRLQQDISCFLLIFQLLFFLPLKNQVSHCLRKPGYMRKPNLKVISAPENVHS